MLTQFLKAAHKKEIWLVIPNAVVIGKLAASRGTKEGIELVKLRNVTIIQAGVGTEFSQLLVPTFQVSAWGTDDESFDHLSPLTPL